MLNSKRRAPGGVPLDMTPMIDVVFQLLAFFLMTFRVVAAEGDFQVRMPLTRHDASRADSTDLPLRVRLAAAPGGELSRIELNGQAVESFAALHAHVYALVGSERGPGSRGGPSEVELDCDSELAYHYVIEAVTAVSGHVAEDGRVVKLFDKIRFAPRRAP
jgi:biopolymer transport protein ExbD